MLKLTGAWFYGVPGVGDTTKHPLNFLGLIAMYGGLVLFMRVWYGLIRTLSQVKGVPVRKLVMVLALWIAPLLLAPPLFSRDIYSYAAQGEMMSHHISPYHYGPGVLGAAPSVSLVDHLWLNTPGALRAVVHGDRRPLTSASGHNELVDLALLRLLALVGVGLMALSIPSLARSLGRDPSYAFTMAVLEPGHDPPPRGGCPQRRPHARPARGRPGRGASRETGGGHRAVRVGRGREGPGRAGCLLHRLELDGDRSACARPDTARGHGGLDRRPRSWVRCLSAPVSGGAGS